MRIWTEGLPKGTYVRLFQIFGDSVTIDAVDETGKKIEGGCLVGIINGQITIPEQVIPKAVDALELVTNEIGAITIWEPDKSLVNFMKLLGVGK